MSWEDLAPDICRQRLVIEGTLNNVFLLEGMSQYCNQISKVLNMTTVTTPVCNYNEKYGWCAYMHWIESGMHIYGWDDRTPKFFSIDIYTCKKFDVMDAVNFTKKFFGDNLINIAWRE